MLLTLIISSKGIDPFGFCDRSSNKIIQYNIKITTEELIDREGVEIYLSINYHT